MPQGEGGGGKKGGEKDDDTLQVRVRKKHPLIERRRSDRNSVTRTIHPGTAPDPAELGSMYESLEETDRNDQLSEDDRATLRPLRDASPATPIVESVPPMEDEETIVADEPPGAPKAPPAEIRVERKLQTNRKTKDKAQDPNPEWIHDAVRDSRPLARAPSPGEVKGAVPRAPVPKGSGTKAAGAAMRRLQINRIDASMPVVTAPSLKLLRGELTQTEIIALEGALSGELDEPATDPALSPKRTLEHLINEPRFGALELKEQALLLKAVAADPKDSATIKAALAILKTESLAHLPEPDRSAIFTAFLVVGPESRALLALLAARRIQGHSAFADKDTADGSLPQHLLALATGKDVAPIYVTRGIRPRKLGKMVLGALANPERVPFEEGATGVLAILEYALADTAPAEYARICRGAISSETAVSFPGDAYVEIRMELEKQLSDSGLKESPVRIAIEQLSGLVHPKGLVDRNHFVMPGGLGVDAEFIARVLQKIYGIEFSISAGSSAAIRMLARQNEQRNRVPPVFLSLLYERGERLFLFDHMTKDEIFIRAPHGKSTKRPGELRADPRRDVVDIDRGLERISRAELEQGVGVVLSPRT